ncbi:MAG: GntR family transcriptional regulator [Bosea sp.]|mgnify:CR=1 FL=1|uniref:GntR family transcriptional regulator n=1 Tax=unclassified Bosea (in: a-proteobacteria) TaxID=2653178 RepID=UPI0009612EEA|nr:MULTISPECIES: GntR family transcriptional regulator [unclassified Bosea (in: a-proteobacteria)]MBN9457972.1 GntR family transcriptional regulator [Bosea sp. (in: a-proteobacteria)]OJV10495.1 MAG: transcriptional regulator [Bosea sp. 67-29]
MAARKEKPKLAALDALEPPPRRNRLNFFELAYERIEAMLIDCTLKPGRLLTMQDLQDMTGFGRTPIHHAVNRLSADTLITIRPRHGLQIAPIDLARERVLLKLRRDLERFVARLAAERAGPMHRNQMLHMARLLRDRRESLTLAEFNGLDRRIDQMILSTAGEPFLEHTLRPLHTIFRRIGSIYHSHMPGQHSLDGTVDAHLALLNGIASSQPERAIAASDGLIAFVERMFDEMEETIDPSLLDSSVEPLLSH